MNMPPVLRHDDGGNGDGNKHGEWGCNGERNAEREQRNGKQRLAEPKGGPNHGGEKHDHEDVQRDLNSSRDERDAQRANSRYLCWPLCSGRGARLGKIGIVAVDDIVAIAMAELSSHRFLRNRRVARWRGESSSTTPFCSSASGLGRGAVFVISILDPRTLVH